MNTPKSVAQRRGCAVCQIQGLICDANCLLAPYFPAEKEQEATNILKVFSYDYITDILKDIHSTQHDIAIKVIAFNAEARLRDPVGGCMPTILTLRRNIAFYHNQLREVHYLLSYIKFLKYGTPINPVNPTPSLVGDDHIQASLGLDEDSSSSFDLLEPIVLDFLSDHIPYGGGDDQIEIGQAQAMVDPPPSYRVGDQAQASQMLIDFLPLP
ncbi:LOB domain-containing protein 9-like [Chenopodium quinoa]|uniref:LOB domain-containing protein 9-like n=1 Tax=Chenopodium quinoa TaxID=63459 RepID=UPI000B77C563|nr:LOB domain-containing protein 9-like [Chenopodium quinoa]